MAGILGEGGLSMSDRITYVYAVCDECRRKKIVRVVHLTAPTVLTGLHLTRQVCEDCEEEAE